jgi:hypothetical protein
VLENTHLPPRINLKDHKNHPPVGRQVECVPIRARQGSLPPEDARIQIRRGNAPRTATANHINPFDSRKMTGLPQETNQPGHTLRSGHDAPLFNPGEVDYILNKVEEAPKTANLAEIPVLPEAIGFVVPDKLRRHIIFFKKRLAVCRPTLFESELCCD